MSLFQQNNIVQHILKTLTFNKNKKGNDTYTLKQILNTILNSVLLGYPNDTMEYYRCFTPECLIIKNTLQVPWMD